VTDEKKDFNKTFREMEEAGVVDNMFKEVERNSGEVLTPQAKETTRWLVNTILGNYAKAFHTIKESLDDEETGEIIKEKIMSLGPSMAFFRKSTSPAQEWVKDVNKKAEDLMKKSKDSKGDDD
jgi:hypothetical protein